MSTTNSAVTKLYKPKKYDSSTVALTDIMKKNQSIQLSSEQSVLFQTIYDWRNLHARILDESPEALFTVLNLFHLVKQNVRDRDSMIRITGTASESFSRWEKPLLQLLQNGKEAYDKFLSVDCHNCGRTGHLAWGCPEPASHAITRAAEKADPEARKRQQDRRATNWARNQERRRAELQLESQQQPEAQQQPQAQAQPRIFSSRLRATLAPPSGATEQRAITRRPRMRPGS